MTIHTNPLIPFLSAYAPHAAANSIYDEFVTAEAARQGCAPLDIPQPLVAELADMLSGPGAMPVILTGTAGDGKTYTARKVLETLSDGGAGWGNAAKVLDHAAGGRRIRFVKDLSELNEADKDALYPAIRATLTGVAGADLFVICVNDGHLLRFFGDREREADGTLPEDSLHRRLREMLRGDEERDPAGNFRLINMSRQPHDQVFGAILDQITDHPGWAECAGCPALDDAAAPCPIRVNRDVLARTGTASMRGRLADIIRMAAANGDHLPIRQLILMVVNALLGERGGKRDLMTCRSVQTRDEDWSYADACATTSVFGDNLAPADRDRYAAFTVLAGFSAGRETNNWFDGTLLSHAENEAEEGGTSPLPDHPLHGLHQLRDVVARYRLDPEKTAPALRQALIDQRRRLFFAMPVATDDPRHDPWVLTAYRHGASYVALVAALEGGPGNHVPRDLAPRLVRALNRVSSGAMTQTDDALWLTAPSGVHLGHPVPLLIDTIPLRATRRGEVLKMQAPSAHGRPPRLVVLDPGSDGPAPLAALDLDPLLVEGLFRVADGGLPSALGNRVQQRIDRFRLHAAAALQRGNFEADRLSLIESDGEYLRHVSVKVLEMRP